MKAPLVLLARMCNNPVGKAEALAAASRTRAWPVQTTISLHLVLLFFAVFPARGDSPTFPVPVSVEVTSGETVEIELQTKPVRSRTKYLLRSTPAHGLLGDLRMTDEGIGLITYTANPDLQASTDEFTYTAQRYGGTVSVVEKISIKIVSKPPRLVFKSQVEFGDVEAGVRSQQKILVTNQGGLPYSGLVSVEAPWAISTESSKLTLQPGASADIEVDFLPMNASSYDAVITFEGQPGRVIKLSGVGHEVFNVSPSSLVLARSGGSLGIRSGVIAVSSLSSRPQVVSFLVPDFIAPIADLTLEPDSKCEILILADEKSPAGGEGPVSVVAGGRSQTLRVTARPLPATLQVDPPGPVHLFQSRRESSGVKTLTITNRGGSGTDVLISSPKPVRCEPLHFRLSVGESRQVSLSLDFAALDYDLRARLLLEYEGGRTELEISADAANNPNRAIAKQEIIQAVPNFQADPAVPQEPGLIITDIAQTENFVLVLWHDPTNKSRTYKLDSQRIVSQAMLVREEISKKLAAEKKSPEEMLEFQKRYDTAKRDDRVFSEWTPMSNVEIASLGNSDFQASFPLPQTARKITVRITPIEANGKASRARSVVRIPVDSSLQSKSNRWPIIFIVGVVLAGGGFFLLKKLHLIPKKSQSK